MTADEFRAWYGHQRFSSWNTVAAVLGLPAPDVHKFRTGEERIPIEIDFACQVLECWKSVAANSALSLYFSRFWFRIQRLIQLPQSDPRREELTVALLSAFLSVRSIEEASCSGTFPAQVPFVSEPSHAIADHSPQGAHLDSLRYRRQRVRRRQSRMRRYRY